ncbi:hypothetical protein AHF37_00039 [Paragonimus kellicotti]|nr:hypothetical protein AHF37_00039 [Paragonimus kellicotti]
MTQWSVRAVGRKFSHVLCPRKGHELVKEWDLWGPLILCLVMSVLLHSSSDDHSIADGGPEFAQVFVIFWLGAAMVTLNSKLIGGAVSFLQTVCILGYCILPLVISLVFCRILLFTSSDSLWIFTIRLLVVAFGLVYSSFASFVFLIPTQPANRVGMALYPICLLYFFFAWLVISVPSQLLHSSSDDHSIADGGPEFAQVFVIFWLGAAMVTLNSKLIGGAVLLHSSSDDHSIADGGPEFAQVFVIFWLGAAMVTLNSKLIGGAVSFLQTVCILGYCILPLVISLVFCRILLFTSSDSLWIFTIRLLVVAFGLVYSSFASFVFLIPTQPANRVGMALYPICLLYFFFAWLVISVPSQ